jgi:integrase
MSDFLFPGQKRNQRLSHDRMLLILRQIGGRVTVRGMRSAFRDWCAEKTGFQREVVEVCLAHVVGDETERAYARGDLLDKRRAVMQAWADFLEGRVSADVIPLRR